MNHDFYVAAITALPVLLLSSAFVKNRINPKGPHLSDHLARITFATLVVIASLGAFGAFTALLVALLAQIELHVSINILIAAELSLLFGMNLGAVAATILISPKPSATDLSQSGTAAKLWQDAQESSGLKEVSHQQQRSGTPTDFYRLR